MRNGSEQARLRKKYEDLSGDLEAQVDRLNAVCFVRSFVQSTKFCAQRHRSKTALLHGENVKFSLFSKIIMRAGEFHIVIPQISSPQVSPFE